MGGDTSDGASLCFGFLYLEIRQVPALWRSRAHVFNVGVRKGAAHRQHRRDPFENLPVLFLQLSFERRWRLEWV